MNGLNNDVPDNVDGVPPVVAPEWVTKAFAELPVSPDFEVRCEEAARLAYSIEKLRREYGRRGFFPLSVESYVARLAECAGVRLASVLDWIKLSSLRAGEETFAGLGRLLRAIGFSLEEAFTILRVSLVEQNGSHFLPARIVYRGGEIESTELDRARIALDEIENGYGEAQMGVVRRMKEVLDGEYAA